MNRMILRVLMLSAPSLAAAWWMSADAAAENWPQWRGPSFTGVAEPGDYPTSWGPETNIRWKVDLPGAGASTPVVWEDRIFLTSVDNQRNRVLAYDRSGQPLWNVDGGEERSGKHKKATGANPSPCTDGKLVFAYFKSGDLIALTTDGDVVWRKNLQDEYGEDTLWWDLGSSPILVDNLVVVTCMQTEPGPSYLAAFDKATGRPVWKADRKVPAPEEAAQSYTTPVVARDTNGDATLIVAGADHVTAHRAKDGEELWRVGGLNPTNNGFFRSIASPVVVGDLVVAPYARGSSLTAIRLGGRGDVTASHIAWQLEESDEFTDVPTPAAANGRIYVCQDKRKAIRCLDAQSGKTIWEAELPRSSMTYSASPILAGDKLYAAREDGACFVLNPENGELIGEGAVDGFTVATPVLVDDTILFRTKTQLYCIGK